MAIYFGENMDSQAALAQYQQAAQNQQSGDQIYNDTSTSLGVPQAQQQVSGLRSAITQTTNLLNNVAPSVYGRTQNSLVTNAQAGRQIQNESAPIQQTLSKQGDELSNDQSNLSGLLSQASTLAGLKQSSQNDKLTSLESIYKALYGQEQDKAAADEKARQFNASLTASSSSGGGSSGGSAKAQSPAQAKQQAVSATYNNLYSMIGRDNHVGPGTWAKALAEWNNEGYSTTDFVKQFQQFINPHTGSYVGFTGKYY